MPHLVVVIVIVSNTVYVDGATNVENELWHGIEQNNWLATRNSSSPQITADAGPE